VSVVYTKETYINDKRPTKETNTHTERDLYERDLKLSKSCTFCEDLTVAGMNVLMGVSLQTKETCDSFQSLCDDRYICIYIYAFVYIYVYMYRHI
jgi:hypothetical protein